MPLALKDKSLRLYRAFADPIRLRILRLLREAQQGNAGAATEICVCDLVSILAVPQPTASRHLAYLRKTGLVQCRRDGQWCYYRLATPAGGVHRKLLETLDAAAEALPQMARDARRLKVVCCDSNCC